MITYQVADFTDTDNTVEVIYKNENNQEHKRTLNIPRNSDGTLNDEYWNEILEGQLRGVERKYEVGAISFIDPNNIEDSVSTDPPEDLNVEE